MTNGNGTLAVEETIGTLVFGWNKGQKDGAPTSSVNGRCITQYSQLFDRLKAICPDIEYTSDGTIHGLNFTD